MPGTTTFLYRGIIERLLREFERGRDLDAVLQIWLETNASAHAFVPRSYWLRQSALVREALPQAEVYVEASEDDGQVRGFVGLTGDFIAGLFVRASAQSQGIGRALLQRAKADRSFLRLGVYKKNPRDRLLSAGGVCDRIGGPGREHERAGIHHGVAQTARRRGGGPMSARQNALYRGGLLVSAGAVLGGIGLAALLAFLALCLRKKKKEGW